MITTKSRENRRGRVSKVTKNIERLLKETKCKECSVIVTRMDFAKILGKFTKVKIQYESASSKTKKDISSPPTSPSNSRLKNNENGMVQLHRNSYNQHPAKEITSPKKSKGKANSPRPTANILKENNRLKTPHTPMHQKLNNTESELNKLYGISFGLPDTNITVDVRSQVSLPELLPAINQNILPSEDWCIDYLPNPLEPKDDKVYDRIAAELEDLMYNDKSIQNLDAKNTIPKTKTDEFPSIMDILNETDINDEPKDTSNQSSIKTRSHLESNDVEAMLLGESNDISKPPELMDIDQTATDNLTEDKQIIKENNVQDINSTEFISPQSPSILDNSMEKNFGEHLPNPGNGIINNVINTESSDKSIVKDNNQVSNCKESEKDIDLANNNSTNSNLTTVTHVVFKKSINGTCYKAVTFSTNLKFNIEFEGKLVEFIGAPKSISSLEDLKVLLQIVNESDLKSSYVLC